MNKSIVRLSGYVILVFIFSLATVQADNNAGNDIAILEAEAAKDFVEQHENAVIMDVRTPEEFDMSHISGAININVLDDDFESMAVILDRDKTYVVHCTKNPGNGRSSRALSSLQSLGFKNLYSLEGGYLAWKEADLPLTEADN